MTKYSLALALILVLLLTSPARAQPPLTRGLPTPCLGDPPNVYLIVDATRRHIVDWTTFLSLGYLQSDIIPCGDAANDPLGAPITRLFKGSEPPLYWLKDGVRHHIPDMDTFNALGFRVGDITVLPDAILMMWPLGTPLLSQATVPGDSIYLERLIGGYTIHLWHPGQGLFDYATITASNYLYATVQNVESLGQLPVPDVTGDGSPDVLFLIRSAGSSHCCWGTVLYALGAAPSKVLDILSPGDQLASTGRGEFRDLDGDGVYEFITRDPLAGFSCSQPTVTAILHYDRARGQYVGASPRFASFYRDEIAQLSSEPHSGAPCDVYPLVTTLLYAGKTNEARQAFDRLYRGTDVLSFWTQLQTAVAQGRFYVPA